MAPCGPANWTDQQPGPFAQRSDPHAHPRFLRRAGRLGPDGCFLAARPRVDQGDLHFLEYNANSPGGLGYGDVLGDLFVELPMRRFAQEYHLTRPPVRRRYPARWWRPVHGLVPHTADAPVERPNIAIVDWCTVRTRNEFLLSQQIFEAEGSRVIICDPGELALRDGRLWAEDDFLVDIVYKRVVVNELDHPYPHPASYTQPLVQAVAQNMRSALPTISTASCSTTKRSLP